MPGHLLSDEMKAQIEATILDFLRRNIYTFRQPHRPAPDTHITHLAKSTATIAKGATGDMTVYFRNSSGVPTISDPVITLEDVMAEMGAYTANKLAYVEMVGGRWVIKMTECAT